MNYLEYFNYDLSSPSGLLWAKDRWCGREYKMRIRKIGDVAGYANDLGYYKVELFHKAYAAHRIIWELHNGILECKQHIDHIDGDPSNNSIDNLRIVTHQTNHQNRKKPSNNISGVTGVYFAHQKKAWIAQWYEHGRLRSKNFSLSKYTEAFVEACKYRNLQIEHLNSQGQQYSERHGI